MRKKESPPWFEQMFLSWTGCPALVGEFETGCHTEAGNHLVLYMTTTKRFNDWYNKIIESSWKHFTKGEQPLFPKDGINKELKYNILNAGIRVPSYIGRYTYPKVKRLYDELLKSYEKEMGEKMEGVDENTVRDLQNWIMRELNVWMNENKRNLVCSEN